ncbi:TonB-dependent receptor [Sphingobium sp. DC-2]|uniref:TonB-dependent receptor n=1 Tax=Sphingobium sp. DC-2 TaxID=1303256 RepID=UPI0004C46BED|nr:TonB-dependent receptor [Sphingobium sp. DC-2]
MRFWHFTRAALMAGSALAGLAPAAYAQQATEAQSDVSAADPASGDIIVTATRRNQSLQDVPVVVTAVSGEQIKELNFTTFTDIQALSPGLSFTPRGSAGTVTALRGVSTSNTTGAPPAVVIYFNEVPINDAIAFQSLYDIGQIEVVRGPQGTLRGAPAPAGSITLATRRPDLHEVGGYVQGIATDQLGLNGQFAVNFPIVQDQLALRVAGLYDRNENGDVHSLTTGVESGAKTKSIRASLLWEPMPQLSILATYQYLRNAGRSLATVEGSGLGYNGPVIRDPKQRVAVQEDLSYRRLTAHYASLSAKYDLGDASINYIGGYNKFRSVTPIGVGDNDPGNAIPGYSEPQNFDNPVESWSHELRLDGKTPGGFLDYTVGGFYSKGTSDVTRLNIFTYLPGAFGGGAVPVPGAPAAGGVLVGDITLPIKDVNKSLFASGTFHLPTNTEIFLGARHIWSDITKGFNLDFNSPFIPVITEPQPRRKFKAWVYDAKIVQHLNEDLLVYAAYGHGWRGPGSNQATPVPNSVRTVSDEKSDNFEIGFKGEFLDKRLRFNAAIFQQNFDGYIARARSIPNVNEGGLAVTANDITFNGDARVRGAEAELYFSPSDRFYVQGSVGYANGKFKNASIPCRDTNFDGVPDSGATPTSPSAFPAGTPVAFCRSNGALSDVPKWNTTLLSEYNAPLGQATAYLRGLFTWQSKTTDIATGNNYGSYGIVNLFLGAREIVPGLDVNIFAKNIFNVQKVTFRDAEYVLGGYRSGYNNVNFTPPREVGVTARFSFGGG